MAKDGPPAKRSRGDGGKRVVGAAWKPDVELPPAARRDDTKRARGGVWLPDEELPEAKRDAKPKRARVEGAEWRPAEELRLAAPLLEPTPKHYNGQGVVRPSQAIALHSDDFEHQWRQLWALHVNFGTAVSHKKLAKKAEKAAMASDVAQYAGPPSQLVLPMGRGAKQPAPAIAARVGETAGYDQRKRSFQNTKAGQMLMGIAPSSSS
ncbi:hypothetical protein T492DRAFT_1093168 [Pavlovales sp. CCMP2436]|nr:hypothetical protein T492DRAFT_1093168 [Pavlovales sp. CCMP2436]|mmetsp:Transcript_40935/g.94800  ORF Transcript_40935/g.94800 Transcript_40935/m.94800 type:complete len:208 (-) Transcript_40935:262-885(-)